MSQLYLPGLEPPSAACLHKHPLYERSLCIYATGHQGKHGSMVPGTSMIQEWGDDETHATILTLVPKQTKTPTTEKVISHRRVRAI